MFSALKAAGSQVKVVSSAQSMKSKLSADTRIRSRNAVRQEGLEEGDCQTSRRIDDRRRMVERRGLEGRGEDAEIGRLWSVHGVRAGWVHDVSCL